MSNYKQRQYDHDEIAVPYFQMLLAKYNLSTIPHGIEIHDNRLQKALMALGRSSSAALRDRFKPDLYVISDVENLDVWPIQCEVKSERRHNNFSIEFDSYDSALMWNNNDKTVMYSFVKIDENKDEAIDIKCCWVSDVKISSYVRVPKKRKNWRETINELTAKHPYYTFLPDDSKGGSGTPFFIVPGNASYLKSFDNFMDTYLNKRNECIQLDLF